MFNIPGRNEACWCGSEKKFKKCHLNREHEPPLARQDFEQQTKKHTKTCCAETLNDGLCTTKIIKAHTISKSGSLKQIAENGHVMGTKTSLTELIETDGSLVTKKLASTMLLLLLDFVHIMTKNSSHHLKTRRSLYLMSNYFYSPIVRRTESFTQKRNNYWALSL